MSDLRGLHVADQRDAASEAAVRRAEQVGPVTWLDEIPPRLETALRSAVADTEAGCAHVLGDGWHTRPKIMLASAGLVSCDEIRCVLRLHLWIESEGLLADLVPTCLLCDATDDVDATSITLRQDALTCYFSVCRSCCGGLTS